MFVADKKCGINKYSFEESGNDSTGMICGGETEVFLELFTKPDTLFIFGGGHICQSLTRIMTGMNFRIVVVDNRPEFARIYKPPIGTILTDEKYENNFPDLDNNSYVVIVTHGHKHDKEILSKVITKECAYVGMIGSRNKIKKTYAALENEGIDKSLFKKVHAPIGIDIGAEGPHEIAVSIAAEIISIQKKSK
jgi:xanthine dehydrogenase accessory factor